MSSADLGITVPGLTKIEWTDLKEKSKLGEGSFEEVYSANLLWLKSLEGKKNRRERFICERSANFKWFAM